MEHSVQQRVQMENFIEVRHGKLMKKLLLLIVLITGTLYATTLLDYRQAVKEMSTGKYIGMTSFVASDTYLYMPNNATDTGVWLQQYTIATDGMLIASGSVSDIYSAYVLKHSNGSESQFIPTNEELLELNFFIKE